MPTPSFYPNLNSVVTVDSFPEELQFIEQGLQTIMSKIYYKHFQFTKSPDGAHGFYGLTLVTNEALKIDILNTGFAIVLNPGSSGETTIPLTLNYNWPVVSMIEGFKLQQFSSLPADTKDLFLTASNPADTDLIADSVSTFEGEETVAAVNRFIDKINAYYSLSGPNIIAYPAQGTFEEMIEDVWLSVKNTPSITDDIYHVVSNVYISSADQNIFRQRLNSLSQKMHGLNIDAFIKTIIIPRIDASLDLSIGIAFPRSILVPLSAPIENGGTPLAAPEQGMLVFVVGTILFSTSEGIRFEKELSASLNHPCRIGNTQLGINIANAKVDLSRNSNILEANLDGRGNDFVGVYVQEATISFPAFWNHDAGSSTAVIKGRNLLIGTGGFSGSILLESAQASGGTALFRLGDPGNTGKHFQLGLTQFSIEFHQGSIVQSAISGYMKIPGLKDANNNDAQIDVTVHFTGDGDFKITASEADGVVFRIPNVLDIMVKSLSFGKQDDKWFIEISGSILLTVTMPGVEVDFMKQPIDIKNMRIWQDGSIEFPGGGITLPTQFHLKVGPVSLALDHIGFGSHEGIYQNVKRQYSYFGFNGQLNTGPAGVDVRGDGVEFHFTRDSGPFHSYLRIAGIGIDIKIPGNASEESADILIKGYLAMRNGNDANGNPQPAGPEYQGSISLNIKPLRIAAKASMSMRPKVPAYIVDVELDLATPIPLGPTGLGIYGFRGLVGSHYVASKPWIGLNENDSWFEYLKKKWPPRNQQGIGIEKFDPTRSGFSLGVGASIATMGDDGWAFSSKVFVMISMPEMLLIEGQANALHKRLGIESEQDPPFYAFIIIDKNSVQAGIGVNYKLPDGGEILSIRGEMQLGFFFNNSSAWYINIGKDLPEDKRVQARLFTLFNAYAYLMLSNQGIKAGAGAKFEMQKKFGPVKVGLYAFIDTKGFISFKPIQIGGSIVLGGGVYIKVGRFGIELHVTAGLSAEAPKPFIISGFVEIRIKIVFVKIRIKLEFTWIFNSDLNTTEVKLIDTADFVSLPDNVAMYPFKAINMLSSESFKLKYIGNSLTGVNPETDSSWNSFIIPMDSFVDIEFKRPLKPFNTRFGGGINPLPQFTEYISPQKARMPQVKHSYSVENVEIKIWNRTTHQWEDYNMWEALTMAFQNAGLTVNTSTYDFGFWQYNNVPGKYTSLRLLSQSPFSVSNGVPPENYGIHSQMILCQGQQEIHTCQYWNTMPLTKIYEQGVFITDRKLKLFFNSSQGSIGSMPNIFGIDPSLKMPSGNSVEIYFKEPMVSVDLRLTSLTGAGIVYYTKVFTGAQTVSGLPAYEYQVVSGTDLMWDQLMRVIHYENPNTPISKIVIDCSPCTDTITDTYNAYWSLLYDMWLHGGDTTEPWQQQQIAQWLHQYGGGGSSDPVNLCPVWFGILDKDPGLNQDEITWLHTWVANFCQGNPPPDGALEALCKSWIIIIQNKDKYPILYPYAVDWQSIYCNGGGGGGQPTDLDLCALYLHEVCTMNEKDWEYNIILQQNNQQTINVGINSLSQAINQALPPVWRPDSYFAVVVSTKDKLTASGTSTNISYDGKFAIGFRTAGTLGFFHKTQQQYLDLEAANKTDQYKLANLRYYIDYERSYPNAEGRLVGAKPLYYKSPKIGLFFIKPYVYEFFTKWDTYKGNPVKEYILQSVIRDPVDRPGDPPVIPAETIGWQLRIGAQAIPVDAFDIETISNILVQGNPNCTGITNILKPPTMNAEIKRNYDIKPQKLYTAIFKAIEVNASGNQESIVHSYTFETSRYGNFTEHIESYIRRSTNPDTGVQSVVNAFFPVILERNATELTTLNSKLQQVLNNTLPTTDPLIVNFASVYDRIVNGILEMKALQAPTGTELNIIKANNTDNNTVTILGILVKSPEPFNDPKLPAVQMANTLGVTDQSNNSAQFITVFSKDNSAVFITNATLSLPLHTLTLGFTLVKYDGVTYENFEKVNVPIDLSII